MARSNEEVKALEKHMEFLLKIPVEKLEAHSNECLQYRGLSELELEESYQARKLSFNLLDSEKTNNEDFLKKFYEIQVHCNMDDEDKFIANDTLFKRKDNCTYAGKLIFIPVTSVFQFDLNIIREYYHYNYNKVVNSIDERPAFMEWLDEKLKESCKIKLEYNSEKIKAYTEKHFGKKNESDANTIKFTSSSSSDSNSDLLNYKSGSSYNAPSVWSDDGMQKEQKRQAAPTMVKERPDTGYLFTNASKQEEKQEEKVVEPEPVKEEVKVIEKEVKQEAKVETSNQISEEMKAKSKVFKEDCIDTIRKIVSAYERNVFRDKTNTELKAIAKNFIEHTKDLAMEGDDWVQKKDNPKIEKALENITADYRKLVCCRQRDAKSHGCVVCPSPHQEDVRKDPLRYVNRSLEFLIKH